MIKMNVKCFLCILLCCMISVATYSQGAATATALRKAVIAGNKAQQAGWTAYEGQIGDHREIHLLLNLNYEDLKEGQSIEGEYFYRKYGRPIALRGSFQKDRIILKEYVDGKHTGTINLEKGRDAMDGTWQSPKGKTYDVQLYKDDFGDYIQRFYYKQYHRITNPKFKAFVELFDADYTPSSWSGFGEARVLSDDLVAQYLEEGFKEKKAEYDMMFYEYSTQGVYFREDYIILTTAEEHSPGVAGVSGVDYRMHTFTYDGKAIDQAELGCECIDIDMGIDEDHGTGLAIILDWNKMAVLSHYVHSRSGEPIDRSTSTYYYRIGANGKIKEL